VTKGRGSSTRASLLLPLERGDVVQTSAGATAELVLFANGARFVIPAASAATMAATNVERKSGAAPQAKRNFAVPSFAMRRGNERILGLVVRTGELGPHKLFPNGGLQTGVSTLKWDGPIDAHRLEARILQPEGSQNGVQSPDLFRSKKLPISTREVALPAGLIQPGKDYVWVLSALAADGDVLQSRAAWFRVLTGVEKEALEKFQAQVAELRSSEPNSPVPDMLVGISLERLGCWREAREAFRAALKYRPGDVGLVNAIKDLDEILED